MATPIFLIGLRGTGKSTIGRLLADRLGVTFVDADAELESRAGRTIREIFAADGEQAFRDLESLVLADLIAADVGVIATGGGVVLRESNRQRMRAGRVVWLTANVDELWQRLKADPASRERRPDLTVGGRDEIAQLALARDSLYRACADHIIDTTGRTPEAVTADIFSYTRLHG